MNATILDKVQQYYPRLTRLVENYRTRHEAAVELAIIDAVLNSDNRWFARDEILYLARLKANADSRMRAAQEEMTLRLKHARRLQRYCIQIESGAEQLRQGTPDALRDDDRGTEWRSSPPSAPRALPPSGGFYIVRDEDHENSRSRPTHPFRIV